MKYLSILLLAIGCVGCARWKPDHIGLTSGYELEQESGKNLKHKHKVGASMDWHL